MVLKLFHLGTPLKFYTIIEGPESFCLGGFYLLIFTLLDMETVCMQDNVIEKLNNIVTKQYCFENSFDLTDSLKGWKGPKGPR